MNRFVSRVPRVAAVLSVTAALIAGAGGSLAQRPPATGTTPANPHNSENQMIIACMQQQDPALKKQDAVELCKKKLKQGIDIDKPKKKNKPAQSNETPPNEGKEPPNNGKETPPNNGKETPPNNGKETLPNNGKETLPNNGK
jgi:hypothetical protein